MDMTKIAETLGAAVEDLAAQNGASLPEYHPTTETGLKGYDKLIDAMNRLPRPALMILTVALFAYAALDPAGFAARMRALAAVPEPLWWMQGAVVTFYFGARETHYARQGKKPVPKAPQSGTVRETP